jgi:hypothetical protein
LAQFPNSPALKVHVANALLLEQTDLGPFADCHENLRSWKYASEADKSKSKSRALRLFDHEVMAKLYALRARDFNRSVEEAEAAMEIAPNDPTSCASLSTFLSSAGRIDQTIE